MDFSIMPPNRISNQASPQLKIYSRDDCELKISIKKDNLVIKEITKQVSGSQEYSFLNFDTSNLAGKYDFCIGLSSQKDKIEKSIPYEVVTSNVNSTQLLDGCWISLVHWSDKEAKMFNKDLRNLTDEDWKNEIEDMHSIGIDNIVIQNVFDNDEYAFRHSQSVKEYAGKSFYPSKIFSNRYEGLNSIDPLKAIFEKAEELNMNVFLGIGLFAWFDFSKESLEWHKVIANELFKLYGSYKSFYSFYISEELYGNFYEEYEAKNSSRWTDVPQFFNEFAEYIKVIAPTKPISLAPNNIEFFENRDKWLPTLANVDILLPFGFARDKKNSNILDIKQICKETNTHLWVDMEIFKFPFEDTGLIPKKFDELLDEIEEYDMVENIFGYQYTGLISNPEREINLGGIEPQRLYEKYKKYYQEKIVD